ncbi:MAG: hypothetical protein ACYS1A_20055, partial [Planctomycetota bacterium]
VDIYIENGLYTATIPQKFLDTAVYPVVINDTFGYVTIGGTLAAASDNYIAAFGPYSPASDGTATQVSNYWDHQGNDNLATYGLYNDDGGDPKGGALVEDTDGGTVTEDGWHDLSLTPSASVLSANTYWIGRNYDDQGGTRCNHAYDENVGYDWYYKSSSYSAGVLPDPFPNGSAVLNDFQISIYVTYTPSGPSQNTKTFTTDSYLQKTQTKTFTADAYLQEVQTKTFTADAYLIKTQTQTVAADAYLLKVQTKTFTSDAWLYALETKTFTADAYLQAIQTKTFTADAYLTGSATKDFTADSFLLDTSIKAFTSDAQLVNRYTKTLTSDAWLYVVNTKTLTSDAYLSGSATKTVTVDAYLLKVQTKTLTVDAYLFKVTTKTFTVDCYLLKVNTKALSVDGWLQKTQIKTFTTDAYLLGQILKTFTSDAYLEQAGVKTKTFTADAFVAKVYTKTYTADSFLANVKTKAFTIDSYLQASVVAEPFTPTGLICITFCVPAGYQNGDYAKLHGNGGSGDINWDNPLDNAIYELFPGGDGIFGFGRAPWGNFYWGHAHSMRAAGWGHLPWGHFPWSHGSAIIRAYYGIGSCGRYKFGFACYDKFGNLHEGAPEEIEIEVHTAPPAPAGLKKNSYNKSTDVLVLDVAT